MHHVDDPGANAVAQAAAELAQLSALITEARAELIQVQQEIWESTRRSQAVELVQANEQLLISTLQAQIEADAAARALEEVSRTVELDVLTGLPNRVLLRDRLVHAIANARRHQTRLALLFIDLDDFKQINDTLGHAVGDEVLKHVAECLVASIREVDTVSRHGGDEFLILLDEISGASDAALVAEKVIATLGAPCWAGARTLQLRASIGISVYPDDAEDANTLITRADAAMYHAKGKGLGGYAFHGEIQVHQQAIPRLPRAPSAQRLAHHHRLQAKHDSQHAQMMEVTQHLLQAALSAQDLQSVAERAHKQQSGYLAVLAHELRNPLTPLRTAAELLGQIPHTEDTMLPRLQAIIERQVMHMTRMVSDLLDVSRVSTGKLRIERHPIDLAAILGDAADACRPAMDKRGQCFSVEMPPGPLALHGDPVRLAQVFGNLLDNASRYTPEGGEIGLSVVTVADAIEITVSDNGIGISAETLPFVFDPFVQDAHATDFSGIGLGIGLTLVRELVEAHGGHVVATSAGTGLGSAFVVTLPSSI